MNKCPYRHDIPLPPPRIAALPVDKRGYPIPYFVSYWKGEPEFRLADSTKLIRCLKQSLCWVCGQPLGSNKAFVIGPMCSISRTTTEPPSHFDCANYSVMACPFLTKPQMVRREDELTDANKGNVAGEMIERNPGVSCVWVTKSYKVFPDPKGKPLIKVGNPLSVAWWKEGRQATRAEVEASIESGCPALLAICGSDHEEIASFNVAKNIAIQYLPQV